MPSVATPTPMYCVVHCLMKTSQHHTPVVRPRGLAHSASSGRSAAIARPHCLMSAWFAMSEDESTERIGEWRALWKQRDVGGENAGECVVTVEVKEKEKSERFSTRQKSFSQSGRSDEHYSVSRERNENRVNLRNRHADHSVLFLSLQLEARRFVGQFHFAMVVMVITVQRQPAARLPLLVPFPSYLGVRLEAQNATLAADEWKRT